LPISTPPVLNDPPTCPGPDPHCNCPTTPSSNPNCLEELIAKQTTAIAVAGHADSLKKDLNDILGTAKTAASNYKRDTYDQLVSDWAKQDVAIAELIRKLVCAVPCWRCILDCYVCPLLNDLHYAEKWLYDDGKLYTDVNNLYDLQYWHTRDNAGKKRQFNRIDGVLKVWQDPAQLIKKALDANRTLTDAAGKVIGTEAGKAIYDVFLTLVPMHLAIAPPAADGPITKIDAKFTKFCGCDTGTPDACCGPDVGESSLRQRLIGPQPYLIDPNEYFMLICCLVENRWVPAKDALSKSDTDLAEVTGRIIRYEKQLADGLNPKSTDSFEKKAKAAIPSVIDCCDYEQDDDDTQQKPNRAR
jgi:hypothetical protein